MVTGGLMRARMGGHWWSYENQRVNLVGIPKNASKVEYKMNKIFVMHTFISNIPLTLQHHAPPRIHTVPQYPWSSNSKRSQLKYFNII